MTQITTKVGQALKLTLQSTHGSCGTRWIYEIHKTKDKRITTTLHLDKSECQYEEKFHASNIETTLYKENAKSSRTRKTSIESP